MEVFTSKIKKLLGIIVLGYRIIWERLSTNCQHFWVGTKCSLT